MQIATSVIHCLVTYTLYCVTLLGNIIGSEVSVYAESG